MNAAMEPLLFDLDEFEETRIEWVIVGEWGRCGLCGVKTSFNQGGSDVGAVCDACAQIDRCRIREHEAVIDHRRQHHLPGDIMAARCLHCAWFVNVDRFENAGRVPRTVAEVAELMVEHVRPRHASHWGVSHEIADHDRLVSEQARRRARYLADIERAA